jgi:hypothetical protein
MESRLKAVSAGMPCRGEIMKILMRSDDSIPTSLPLWITENHVSRNRNLDATPFSNL